MSEIKRPESQKEMVEQLWYAVIGSNGDGVASITRQNKKQIEEIKGYIPELLPRAEYVQYCADADDIKRAKGVQSTTWRLTIIIIIVSVLSGLPAWLSIIGV